MRRLIELGNWRDAAELVRRLNDAGLTALYTDAPVLGEPNAPISRSTVWIGDDDDAEVAGGVLEEFRDSREVSRASTCDGCGYDLRGHTGAGRCPECGRRFDFDPSAAHVPEEAHDVICEACGEEVPANFECCWNCGEVTSRPT